MIMQSMYTYCLSARRSREWWCMAMSQPKRDGTLTNSPLGAIVLRLRGGRSKRSSVGEVGCQIRNVDSVAAKSPWWTTWGKSRVIMDVLSMYPLDTTCAKTSTRFSNIQAGSG